MSHCTRLSADLMLQRYLASAPGEWMTREEFSVRVGCPWSAAAELVDCLRERDVLAIDDQGRIGLTPQAAASWGMVRHADGVWRSEAPPQPRTVRRNRLKAGIAWRLALQRQRPGQFPNSQPRFLLGLGATWPVPGACQTVAPADQEIDVFTSAPICPICRNHPPADAYCLICDRAGDDLHIPADNEWLTQPDDPNLCPSCGVPYGRRRRCYRCERADSGGSAGIR